MRAATNKINVLVAPSHLVLSDARGSESTWALNIIKYIVRNYREISFSAVCGKLKLLEQVPRLATYSLFDKRPSSLADKLSFIIWYYNVGRRLLKEKSFDIVHHMFPFGFRVGMNLLAVLNRLSHKPFIIGPVQYPNPQLFELGTSRLRLERYVVRTFSKPIGIMNIKTLAASDVLVFDGKKTLDLYNRTYHDLIKGKELVVIPAGIEIEKFRYTRPLAKKYLELLTVGYLVKRKGIQYLLQAMTSITSEFRNVRLRVVGSGRYELTLKKMVKELGIERKVTFEGYVPRPKIAKYYEACDIYVHPALSETFPFTIREAMAVGRPIIGTRVGIVDEYIRNGVHGYLVQPQKTEVLADAIIKLLGNEELRSRMGLNARKYAEENFDWNKVAQKWHTLYTKLVSA